MHEDSTFDSFEIMAGLRKVRSRRWLLWGTILIYLPGMLVALESQATSRTMAWLFGGWVLLLCIVVALATVVKCPRCADQLRGQEAVGNHLNRFLNSVDHKVKTVRREPCRLRPCRLEKCHNRVAKEFKIAHKESKIAFDVRYQY